MVVVVVVVLVLLLVLWLLLLLLLLLLSADLLKYGFREESRQLAQRIAGVRYPLSDAAFVQCYARVHVASLTKLEMICISTLLAQPQPVVGPDGRADPLQQTHRN